MAQKTLVIVAGMHRSGTSALTGVLEGLGVRLGPELAGPDAGINDRGYKEDIDVINLHEDLLWAIPQAWDDILPVRLEDIPAAARQQARDRMGQVLDGYFAGGSLCGLKDPRVCLFLPLWLEVCQEKGVAVRIALAYRQPDGVVSSLARRDDMHPDRAAVLCQRYGLQAEVDSRGLDRIVVDYDQLLGNPGGGARALGQWLDIPDLDDARVEKAAGFLEAGLNRSGAKVPDGEASSHLLACRILHQAAARCHLSSPDEDLQAACEKARADLANWLGGLDPVLQDQARGLRRHGAEFRSYWQDAMASRTMQMTAGLRRLLGRT